MVYDVFDIVSNKENIKWCSCKFCCPVKLIISIAIICRLVWEM